jgi:hypothetical protein
MGGGGGRMGPRGLTQGYRGDGLNGDPRGGYK